MLIFNFKILAKSLSNMGAAVVDRRNISHEATAVRATFAKEQLPEVKLGVSSFASQAIFARDQTSCAVYSVLKLDCISKLG